MVTRPLMTFSWATALRSGNRPEATRAAGPATGIGSLATVLVLFLGPGHDSGVDEPGTPGLAVFAVKPGPRSTPPRVITPPAGSPQGRPRPCLAGEHSTSTRACDTQRLR